MKATLASLALLIMLGCPTFCKVGVGGSGISIK